MFRYLWLSKKLVFPSLVIVFPAAVALDSCLPPKKKMGILFKSSADDRIGAPSGSVRHTGGNIRIEMHTANTPKSFTRDILIRTRTGEYIVAAAALDTQCEAGDWVSKRLVDELGLSDSVRYGYAPARVITVTGEEVESSGSIDLNWKLPSNENRVYRGKFSVLSSVQHLDVILGQDTINKEDLLSASPRRLFAPLANHEGLSKADKAAIVAAEAQQQQAKKDLEARRQAAQQQQSANQSSNERPH